MENFKMGFNDPSLIRALNKIESVNAENGVSISVLPENMVLAMAYVPMQIFGETYDVTEGFCSGTIYPELNKPFLAGGGK